MFPLLLLFITSTIAFWFIYPFPSNEKVAYFQNEHPIIISGEEVSYEGYVEDDIIHLPFSFVQVYLDPAIFYDEASTSVIVTTKDKVIQMPTENLTYYVNNQEHTLSFPAITKKDDEIYLETNWMTELYPMDVHYDSETGAIQIFKAGDVIVKGKASGERKEHTFRLRTEPSLTSPYVAELNPEELVTIEGEEDQFYKIRKENGISGYVQKKVITIDETITVDKKAVEKESISLPEVEWPIHLTWDAIYHPDATPTSLTKYEGVQVISPTWFHLDDDQGTVRSYAKKEYVNAAKEQEYQIWALFSNDFDPEKTHSALKTFETRQKVIAQLLEYANIYELDGFNIDFENVMLEDGPLLTQFMRELTPLAHEAGLIISMDITFISTNERYSMFYEREKLAEIVDYLIVMAYDEHWASSPKAGSVASLPWVEKNLQTLLEVVPHDRLLLGVPLYTRLWKETLDEDGNVTVESKSMSMNEVEQWISEHDVQPIYDEATGQHYVEWKDPDKPTTYKIWIENTTSLEKRAELVHKYQLAGMASWSDYFAAEEVWKDLNESLRTKSVVKNVQTNENGR